jgi:hypothetical protein
VTCKYCKKDVLRKDIERHERRDCDEVPATCEYKDVGCNHDKVINSYLLYSLTHAGFLLIILFQFNLLKVCTNIGCLFSLLELSSISSVQFSTRTVMIAMCSKG